MAEIVLKINSVSAEKERIFIKGALPSEDTLKYLTAITITKYGKICLTVFFTREPLMFFKNIEFMKA